MAPSCSCISGIVGSSFGKVFTGLCCLCYWPVLGCLLHKFERHMVWLLPWPTHAVTLSYGCVRDGLQRCVWNYTCACRQYYLVSIVLLGVGVFIFERLLSFCQVYTLFVEGSTMPAFCC